MTTEAVKAIVAQSGALGWGIVAAASAAGGLSIALVVLFAVLAVVLQLIAAGLVTQGKPRQSVNAQ